MAQGQGERFMTGDTRSFANDMKKLINNKESSDIRFMIGPNKKSVYAQKCILSARCEVFRQMFSEMKPQSDVPLVLADTSVDVFMAFLEFIYTNCATVNKKIVVDLLGCALEYGLDGLKNISVQYLDSNISVDTACETLQAAVTYRQEELQQTTMSFIEHNAKEVIGTKGFHELSDTAVSVIVKSDHLNVDEMDIVRAVREWATVNSVVTHKNICQLAKNIVVHVRLPLLTKEQLKQTEEENNKDKMIPTECFAFAWRHHALGESETGNPLTRPRTGRS